MFSLIPFPYPSKVPKLDLDQEIVLATSKDYLSYLSLSSKLHSPYAPVLYP